MNTPLPQLVRVECVDDLPVLWACLQRLQVATLLDRHFPTHHLWQGELSFGEVVCVWLVFVLSQGDHRLSRLQPWAEQHLLTLQALLGKTVHPLDFHDDRLADILTALAQAEPWMAFENDLNQHTVRVYDLSTSRFRLDSTTANSHADVVSEEGLLQFGHSKDRDDLPQVKVAVAALDPLGMPISTLVVPGNTADDPLYLPLIRGVQQAFGQGGKTYIADCKAAALATRAYLASTHDFYLCPLSLKQVSQKERLEQLQAVWQGQQPLQAVYRPKEHPEDPEELVAQGFAVDVPLQATVDGQTVQWTERRWWVRSVAFASAQEQHLERRVQQAQTEVTQLSERKQGKAVLSASQMQQMAQSIVQKHRVEGLLTVQVQTTRHEQARRRYRDRAAQVVVQETHQVQVLRQETAIAKAKGELAWQVYGVNDLEWSLAGVVWSYRGQFQIEKGWSRLKGQPLGLTPLYLADEERIVGLVLLLSVALRVLTVLQGSLRRKLSAGGQGVRGLYPGQPGRVTHSPSAELLLEAFQGICLTVVEVAGQRTVLLTPLTALQKQLLAWWDFPAAWFEALPDHHGAKPPPSANEP